jgi:hypothetical protein
VQSSRNLPATSVSKVQTEISSEMLVNFYWTTQRYIPDSGTLRSQCHKYLKCHEFIIVYVEPKQIKKVACYS